MYEVLLIIFLIVAISLIVLIMLQQSNGTDIGMSLSGVSNIFFSSSSLSKVITRITKILSALFFVISLALCNINRNKIDKKQSEWTNFIKQTEETGKIQSEALNKANDIPQ